MAKSLLVLRHAEAGHYSGDDHARTLTSRGQEQARGVGRWLLDSSLWPEMTVVSDAMRTRQTCIWVGSELGDKAATPSLDPRLYQASARQLLSVVNETPESVESLLVVAHMPGVQDLSMELASVHSDEQVVFTMAEHWPPGGLAIFQVDKPWAELDGRDAVLTQFRTPAE
ncbi:SixA phosphatase family protein [Nesterenkonia flava]|uniref:Histidine phosphatase family protein n=1 Tax=Nesterenkonia flava TaxID=469799 RepID=A0ABU1FQT3_9MICC|nr:histidine phosphatase family protein [Nesterenkonia flava]MDR5711013.1 histidine phosphatase family protein [Nesterenkonia flava]